MCETVCLRRNNVKTACSLSYPILLSPGLLSRENAGEREVVFSFIVGCCAAVYRSIYKDRWEVKKMGKRCENVKEQWQ